MTELADVQDLGSCAFRRVGSSPTNRSLCPGRHAGHRRNPGNYLTGFLHPPGRLLTGHRRNGRRTDAAKHRKNLHLPNRRQPILYPGRKRHSRHTNPIPNPDANRGANQHPNADPNQRADQGTNQYSNGDADQNANENSKPDPITNESPIPLTNPVSDQNPRQPDRKRQPIHRRPDLPGKMDLRCNRIRHWNRGGIQEKERR